MTRGVLVVQPVHQHAYEAAVALHEGGLLDKFVTGVYFDPRITDLGPAAWQSVASRRSHAELRAESVTVLPMTGIAHLLTRLLPVSRREHAVDRVFAAFDLQASRQLHHDHLAVHVFEGTALRSAQRARGLGVTVVLDVASVFEGSRRAGGGTRSARQFQAQVLRERQLADLLFAPSDRVMTALISAGVPADKIVLVPYGVDLTRFSNPGRSWDESSPLKLLWVGNDSQHKGLEPLLCALTLLGGKDFRLRIVGAQDAAGRVLRGQHPRHEWMGSVPKASVHEHFFRSDVLVLPTRGEGSSLATLEALAAGLVIVATDNIGVPVSDGREGFTLRDASCEAIASTLRRVLRARQELPAMSRHAVGLASKQYSWQRYRRRIRTAYHERVLMDE